MQTDDAFIVYVHDIEEAKECIGEYIPKGFKVFQMDLNVLKRTLIEKVGRN